MYINAGAHTLLLRGERQKFLDEEWPRVCAAIQRLGLRAEDLFEAECAKSIRPDAGKKEN